VIFVESAKEVLSLALVTPGTYFVHLMAQNEQKDYVELPEFTLNVENHTSVTSPVLGVSDEHEETDEDTLQPPTVQPTQSPSRIGKPLSGPTPTSATKPFCIWKWCW
jgi:hypothetical protein